MRLESRGQATVELLISGTLVTLTLLSTCWLLKAQWERGRCAHLVFERTRQAMNDGGSPSIPIRVDVEIWEDRESVHGKARCGDATEEVVLRKIEPST